ncbi:tyrosine-type recombinase/integrase [Halotalea alkalilenta]|uniref:Tyr recombinase domain-containing protein n=1 Tax=Halotalea alkalilenta TaxID=376489 RepID=A0A172YC64_9GAMM|nr:tyrosine-type recombinase/integrase [Halotalea alkalilenta]ANF56814.1 hypothetical protein A5892_04480 [Halotalea alkalilenta]
MKRSEIKARPLAEKTVAALEPEEKAYRERDGGGLYLYVRPDGGKSWELRYRKPDGKYSWLGLGAYPEVKPKEARQKAQEARDLIAQGTTPRQHQKQQEALANAARSETVEALMLEWQKMKANALAPSTLNKLWLSITKHVLPTMGRMPITRIQPAYMLEFFRGLEAQGIHETSAKIRRALVEAFDLAAFAGRVQANPVRGAERFVESPKNTNYAHVSLRELPALIRSIDQYPRSAHVRAAMLLLALNGCRPTELRESRWEEFDLDRGIWLIPAERMKKRRPHTVPLAPISVELLREQMGRTSAYGYVFPNRNDPRKPMSNMAINKGLAYLGYAGRQTGHGFRHVLSTALHERGYPEAHIEAQLAHQKGGVAGVYNKAAYLEQRRAMMNAWADEIASMIEGKSNVVPIKAKV